MCIGPWCNHHDPGRDSSLGSVIASGMFLGSYRAVPVAVYLGSLGSRLKASRNLLQPVGDPFGSLGNSRIRAARQTAIPFDELIGKKEAREQELPRLRKHSKPGKGLAAFRIDQCRRSLQVGFLAIAAGDAIGAAGYGDIDFRHVRRLPFG